MPRKDHTPPKRKVGRPKGAVSKAAEARRMTLREYAMTHAYEVIDTWAQIMNDPQAPHASRVAAGEKILNRAVGQPAQAIPQEGDTVDQAITGIKIEFAEAPKRAPAKKAKAETK